MPVLWIIFKLQSGWSLKLLYEKHYTGWNETNHPRKASYTAVFFLCFWRGQTSGLWDLMFLHSQLIWLELLLQVTGSFTVRSMKGWWRGSLKGNHRRGLSPPFHNTHTHAYTCMHPTCSKQVKISSGSTVGFPEDKEMHNYSCATKSFHHHSLLEPLSSTKTSVYKTLH